MSYTFIELSRAGKFSAILFCFLAFLLPLSVSALDWGILTDHSVEQEGIGSKPDDIHYQAYLIPWLSSPLGQNADLYISAAFNANLEKGEWALAPELFRTEIALDFNNAELKFGRMQYSDPMGYINSGLFDGISFALDSSAGVFSAGAWYTGLLYKKTANINITAEDLAAYNDLLSYDNFADTYFASRRLAFALGWEHYGIKEVVRMKISVLGQADLNGRNTQFHSQYLVARAGIPLGDYFVLDLGGVAGFAEAGEFQASLAGELGLSFFLPTQIQDRLKFTGIFSSGKSGSLSPFIPITTISQGSILKAKISGLSLLGLDYTARLHRTFSFSLASTYFILSDLGTYQGWPLEKNGYFLGNEFFARLIWSPVSDIQFNLGGGLFVPAMGNADPEAGLKWKVELNATLAIF